MTKGPFSTGLLTVQFSFLSSATLSGNGEGAENQHCLIPYKSRFADAASENASMLRDAYAMTGKLCLTIRLDGCSRRAPTAGWVFTRAISALKYGPMALKETGLLDGAGRSPISG